MRKYFLIWKQLSGLAIGTYLSNRIDSAAYLAGKLIRFGFFLLLITSLFRFTDRLGGYSKYEVILFFLTFNLIDVFSQALFRGIYLFRHDISRGNFDFVLSKPVNPLFYSLCRLTDILDLVFLLPIVGLIGYTMTRLQVPVGPSSLLLYGAFVFLSMIIVLGIHIISASITIWKIESENFIWLYRESMTIGRFPPDIYAPVVRAVFIFAMPIIVIVAFPVKAVLQELSGTWMLFALLYGAAFFACSLWLWEASLKKYSSASS
jgi:ABC-2 type transport system permease protein